MKTGLLSGSSAGAISRGFPLSNTLLQCMSCLLLPAAPEWTLLLPAPRLPPTHTHLYLPSALPKPLLWLLLSFPCMLESLLSFPKCMWQCTLFTESFVYYLFLVLCLREFRLWLSKGYSATFSMYLGWGLLGSVRHSVYLLPRWIIPAQIWSLLHLGGYLSYPEITITCWLGNFFLLTPVSGAFCRQYTPKSVHKVA